MHSLGIFFRKTTQPRGNKPTSSCAAGNRSKENSVRFLGGKKKRHISKEPVNLSVTFFVAAFSQHLSLTLLPLGASAAKGFVSWHRFVSGLDQDEQMGLCVPLLSALTCFLATCLQKFLPFEGIFSSPAPLGCSGAVFPFPTPVLYHTLGVKGHGSMTVIRP